MNRRSFLPSLSAAAVLAALTALTAPAADAQVTTNHLNVLCVWNPLQNDYEIKVYRNPGQVLTQTITDPSETGPACSAGSAGDLMNWIQNDLQMNNTWNVVQYTSGGFGLAADQLYQDPDTFCPDVGGQTILPTAIASISGMVYPPNGPTPAQAGAVVNYFCPDNSNPGGPYQPQATFPVDACVDGQFLASALPPDDVSVVMSNIGPVGGGTGMNAWSLQTSNGAYPQDTTQAPVSAGGCDPQLAALAQTYLQGQMPNINPVDFGVDAWTCDNENYEIYVDSCEVVGNDVVFGFEVHCCPTPDPDPVGTSGMNCHSVCMGSPGSYGAQSVAWATHHLGPTTPEYHDPTTICTDLPAATGAWLDANVPSGAPICGINWGTAVGGTYVPGTTTFPTCQVVNMADPQCGGLPRVDYCVQYNCEPRRRDPVDDKLDPAHSELSSVTP